VTANFILLNQTQHAQLLKMVKSDAGTTKMQGSLDLTNSDWFSRFQK
jgi:hypothetical protein